MMNTNTQHNKLKMQHSENKKNIWNFYISASHSLTHSKIQKNKTESNLNNVIINNSSTEYRKMYDDEKENYYYSIKTTQNNYSWYNPIILTWKDNRNKL